MVAFFDLLQQVVDCLMAIMCYATLHKPVIHWDSFTKQFVSEWCWLGCKCREDWRQHYELRMWCYKQQLLFEIKDPEVRAFVSKAYEEHDKRKEEWYEKNK